MKLLAKRAAPPLASLLAMLAFWEAAVHALAIKPYVLPAPSAILAALTGDWPRLWAAAAYTLKVMWLALAAALVSGVALAALVHRSRLAEAAVLPLMVVLQVTPVVAIAPLVVIWVGVDNPERALVILAWVVAFFPIASMTLSGLRAIDPALKDLFALYGATSVQRLVRLELPAVMPAILSGLKVASGLALIGAVVAEFAAGSGLSQGLAWRLLEAGNRFEVPTMFACLLLLALIGVLHYGAFSLLERAVLKRRGVQ